MLESGVCAEGVFITALATCAEVVAKLRVLLAMECEVDEGWMEDDSVFSFPGTRPPITAMLHLGRPPLLVGDSAAGMIVLLQLMLLGPQ